MVVNRETREMVVRLELKDLPDLWDLVDLWENVDAMAPLDHQALPEPMATRVLSDHQAQSALRDLRASLDPPVPREIVE